MHINKIFKEVLPKLDTLEWREQKLYLLDPFLLFYFLPLVPFRRAIAREREALEW